MHARGLALGFALAIITALHALPAHAVQPDEILPDAKLEEPLIVRPTSETVIGSAMSRWVKAKAGVRWQPRPMSLVGLYYRYNYSSERDYTDYQNDYIKQIDLAVQWPITNRLFGLFRYNYSLLQDKPIEMIGGVEYLHDCWTLRFAAQRYTTTSNNDETNFFLQLELNGLGSIGTSPLSELQRNIKGYQTTTRVPDKIGQYDYYE